MKRTEELKAKIKGMAKVGLDGVSCTHEWDGTTLIVTSASGTSSADLKGKQGDKGDPGYTPQKGVDYFDGYTPQKDVDYFDGKGVSVVDVKERTEEGGANVVTFSDGTKLTVMNGTKGADGTMTFEELTPEQKATLKGDKGDRGEKGDSGVYVGDGDMPEGYNVQIIPDGDALTFEDLFTESEKAEIVRQVISALPIYDGSVTSV